MSIFTPKTKTAPQLTELLAKTTTRLETEAQTESEASREYLLAAQRASAEADRASRQATATQEAQRILEEAGVTI